MLKKWWKAAQIYMDKRMLTMIALGFSSGFPLLLVFGTLNLWLKDAGISYAAIGLFSLVKTPYSFKWAWSPIIDRIRLPLFCRLGRRRGWAFFIQIILLFSILGMSTVEPAATPFTMAFFAVLVTVASASQDIVLDAYRIESFNSKEQGAGVAIFVLGYRFGLVFSGAGAIWMASAMDWNDVYKIMALGTIVGMLAVLCSREPAKNEKKAEICYTGTFRKRVKKFLLTAVYDPFRDFTRRADWALILLFIFLYRMSDAYMGPMAYPFYDDMGFSKVEIAYVSKIYGMIATIAGRHCRRSDNQPFRHYAFPFVVWHTAGCYQSYVCCPVLCWPQHLAAYRFHFSGQRFGRHGRHGFGRLPFFSVQRCLYGNAICPAVISDEFCPRRFCRHQRFSG